MKEVKTEFQIIRRYKNSNRKISTIKTISFVTAKIYFNLLKKKFSDINIIDDCMFTINDKITYQLIEKIYV